MTELLPIVVILLTAGVLAGFMAGLMGIGGGIVTIPALYTVFEILNYDPAWRMHMAVGTSLAIILVTSLSSVRAHHQKKSVDWSIMKKWWLWLALGAALGAVFAKTLKTEELIYVFGALLLLLAIKMLLPVEGFSFKKTLDVGVKRFVSPTIIGFFSSLMGIGGGSFTVPYLTAHGVAIHRAVGTAAFGGFIISLAGGLGFLYMGLSVASLPPQNFGFIHLPSAVVMAFASVLMAPVGAHVAHKLPKRVLSIIFGLFLIVAAARLLTAL